MPEPRAVRSMFASIAGSYDLLNRTLSLGIDQRWRRAVLRLVGDPRGTLVADVATGTGDLAALFAEGGARVVGVDFTFPMLERAPRKVRPPAGPAVFVHGDALALPLRDGVADASTIAFGLRNVADRAQGLRELQRVVRPGGKVVVLEFSTPRSRLFGAVYRTYFTRVLPRIGRLISKDEDAYSYLPRTVLAWPKAEELQREMEAQGLEACGFRTLTGGIACLHWGTVPAAGAPARAAAGAAGAPVPVPEVPRP